MSNDVGKTGENFVHGLAMSTGTDLSLIDPWTAELQSGDAVPTLQDFHVLPEIGAALDQLGWTADDPLTRECTPTAARGHNLVIATPPSPVYATPAVAGALSRVESESRALLLCPEAQLDEWGALAQRLIRGTALRPHVARTAARAMRRLRSNEIDILLASPATASALVARSALDLQSIGSLLVAWPESWSDEDRLVPLMQDLPKESQRIIYTADPSRVPSLVERYARKALTVGVTPAGIVPAGPVRTISVSWTQRIRALGDVIELLDPASLAIWTVDRSYHTRIAEVVPLGPETQVVTQRSVPDASTIIAFDLPTADHLRELVGIGQVVLLVPPGTEDYVAGVATPRRPIQLPAIIDSALQEETAQRAAVVRIIEAGRLGRSVATLAPLFERYDPVTVAAALLELVNGSATVAATASTPQVSEATTKVYVGAGKKDGVTPHDLVAVLTKELRVDRQKIGRIELRDTFALIEIPSAEAEQVARGLNGTTIRQRRITARVDQGPRRLKRPKV